MTAAALQLMLRLHLIHAARIQVVSTIIISIACRIAVYMTVSCIGHKFVVNAALRRCMYPLAFGYKLLVRDTCIRLYLSGVNPALGLIQLCKNALSIMLLPLWYRDRACCITHCIISSADDCISVHCHLSSHLIDVAPSKVFFIGGMN